MTKMLFERKFGGKMYKFVHTVHTHSYEGYGGERAAKSSANKKADKLRKEGFSARVVREIHTIYPPRGAESFYAIYARKDGMTLDQVKVAGQRALGMYS